MYLYDFLGGFMNFNIYLGEELGHRITSYAEKQGVSRNSLIRQAITEFIQDKHQCWPDNILEFQGVHDFPAFESNRHELLAPKEDPFA